MITKEKIGQLKAGEVLTDSININTEEGYKYSKRVRNYAQHCKTEDLNYPVSIKDGVITVTCTPVESSETIADKLRSMKPGEIIHPAPSRKLNNIWAIAASVEGKFKVSSVVQVEKLK